MRRALHTLFRGWRAALLLVAVALLSPQRAAAECGDHVTVLNPTARAGHDAPMPSDGEPLSAPKPCNGPGCSKKPDRPDPLSAPVAPSVAPVKQLVPGAGLLNANDPTQSHFDRGDANARPVHRPFSIFHPPRAA